MSTTTRKAWAVGIGLALVAAAGTAVAAEDPLDWYTGGQAQVADADAAGTLTLVDGAGKAVTSGAVDAPFAAYAVADGALRQGDSSASLFVHVPSPSSAAGAWAGTQLSGTTRFAGEGAAAGPQGTTDRPYVALGGALPLSDVLTALPSSGGKGYDGLYQLRLRTGSDRQGVGTRYASAYVAVSGDRWSLSAGPGTSTDPQQATVTATWGADFAYGTTRTVPVTVSVPEGTAAGTVGLYVAGKLVGTQATLDDTGRANVTLPKGSLLPGRRAVEARFTPTDPAAVAAATSAPRTYAVAKGAAPAPTFTVRTRVTARKAGSLTVRVARPSGLVQPTGKVTVVLQRGRSSVTVAGRTLSKGAVVVPVRRLTAGTWKVTVTYLGDGVYTSRKAPAKNLSVRTR
ncbi:Ig-like domain repeat protein [Aeromicrobium sp.]|uniref:Ig-like domain repeat protein n=1 Tax=Aeromicrobium sp. TaxID=1871063 RepID=UPI00351392A1